MFKAARSATRTWRNKIDVPVLTVQHVYQRFFSRFPDDNTMRLNEDALVRLKGSACVLLPYLASHVPRYHSWMEDEELRRLTCSERLSLEEEYANQVSWRDDEHKLTFIIHDAERMCICGDVNLYLSREEDEVSGEIEVMVADPASRRRGLAADALKMMMAYAHKHLGCAAFVAKILSDNAASISLFRKLHFVHVRDLAVFSESHFQLEVSEGDGAVLLRQVAEGCVEESYRTGPTGTALREKST